MGDFISGFWNMYIRGCSTLEDNIQHVATGGIMAIKQALLRVAVRPQSIEVINARMLKIERAIGYC